MRWSSLLTGLVIAPVALAAVAFGSVEPERPAEYSCRVRPDLYTVEVTPMGAQIVPVPWFLPCDETELVYAWRHV